MGEKPARLIQPETLNDRAEEKERRNEIRLHQESVAVPAAARNVNGRPSNYHRFQMGQIERGPARIVETLSLRYIARLVI